MSLLSRSLLSGLIDYAGLFPPAALGMAEAVENYAAYQRRPDHWALARLVVPVARLIEFEAALERLPEAERRGTRWPITALAGPDPEADRAAVGAFNHRQPPGGPAVEAVEARVASVPQIESLGAVWGRGLELYCELPLAADFPALVAAVRRAGARGKVRTGGVKAVDIPAPEAVLAFLAACAAERLPFKATAGLHHPVRGLAPLTYAAGSPCATMFGFLNLVLAASLLWERRPEASALAVLMAEDRSGLRFDREWIEWAGVRITADEIGLVRRDFMLAVGSCSFTEPLGEIRELGLEPGPVGGGNGGTANLLRGAR
jgi:hypothetical protein